MTWLGCQSNKRKIKNSVIFRTNTSSYLGTCNVQNIVMSLNTLYELRIKSKKVGGILAKSAPQKEKTITNETLHLATNVF